VLFVQKQIALYLSINFAVHMLRDTCRLYISGYRDSNKVVLCKRYCSYAVPGRFSPVLTITQLNWYIVCTSGRDI